MLGGRSCDLQKLYLNTVCYYMKFLIKRKRIYNFDKMPFWEWVRHSSLINFEHQHKRKDVQSIVYFMNYDYFTCVEIPTSEACLWLLYFQYYTYIYFNSYTKIRILQVNVYTMTRITFFFLVKLTGCIINNVTRINIHKT